MGRTFIRCLLLAGLALLTLPVAAQSPPARFTNLLEGLRPSDQAVSGSWRQTEAGLITNAMPGSRLALTAPPAAEYDFRVTFTRRSGVHSIALLFPAGRGQASFEVDAWGQHLAGFQNVKGQSMRENSTRVSDQTLTNGERYVAEVRVRKDRVEGWLNEKLLTTYRGDGSDLTLSDLWRLPEATLGLGAWEAETVFHSVEVRPASEGSPVRPAPETPTVASTGTTKKAAPAASPASPTRAAPGQRPQTPSSRAAAPSAGRTGRVLIVIANHHFFYREYGDPRAELEQAGLRVTVAAGRKAPCRPHQGSGEGADGGVVQPDLALSDVKVDDFDAVLFSGGWGASMYQFAFTGRYNDPAYNGDQAIKAEANRIINEFLAQDKYVCALCNGTSVLAWARVNGRSPIEGKRVCAPRRQAAAGLYNGRPAQPPCSWHAEANGARVSPAGSIGQPGTAADDVLIDGRIITGEDDPSAREMGRQLARVLTQR